MLHSVIKRLTTRLYEINLNKTTFDGISVMLFSLFTAQCERDCANGEAAVYCSGAVISVNSRCCDNVSAYQYRVSAGDISVCAAC